MNKVRVILIAALSADGFIARETHELADWTSKEDKKLFVELTKRAGVMVMGGTTFRTIGKALPGRRNIVYSRQKIEVPGIETTNESPEQLVARLATEDCHELAVCGGRAIYDMFLAASVVDELYLTIEPKLFGQGISLAVTKTTSDLRLLDCKKINDNAVLLHYKVLKK